MVKAVSATSAATTSRLLEAMLRVGHSLSSFKNEPHTTSHTTRRHAAAGGDWLGRALGASRAWALMNGQAKTQSTALRAA